jgi:hypothetical protein
VKSIPLFDALMRETDARSDSGIARLTRTQSSTISRIRNGKEGIGESLCFRIALATGWSAKRVDELVQAGEQEGA